MNGLAFVMGNKIHVAACSAVSRNGTLVYLPASPASEKRELVWTDRQDREQPVSVQRTGSGCYNVRLSPVNEAEIACSGDGDVWILDQEKRRRKLRSRRQASSTRSGCPGPAGDPETISPDGKFFIYHTPAEVAMLALLNPSGPIRPLKPGNSKLLNAEISHDGRWIAYESNESGPKSSPITPALIGRTVKTVISILEPEQPDLIHALHQSLRTAAHTKQPVDLQYRIGGYGPMKHATVMDEGPQKDYLTIICFGTE